MNMLKGIALPGALLGAFVCATAAQTDTYPAKPAATPHPATPQTAGDGKFAPIAESAITAPYRASKLLGTNVVNGKNENIGSLKDVALEDHGGLIAIVKRTDGELTGVPMEFLSPWTDAKEPIADGNPKVAAFSLSSYADKMSSAPITNDVEHIDRNWLTRVREHFGKSVVATNPAHPATDNTPADPTTAPVYCAETLFGMEVKSSNDEDLGKIDDLAINLASPRLAYVVITSGGVLGMNATTRGVAWKSLTLDGSLKGFTISMDKASFDKLPGIDANRLPSNADLQVSAAPLGGARPVAQEPRR